MFDLVLMFFGYTQAMNFSETLLADVNCREKIVVHVSACKGNVIHLHCTRHCVFSTVKTKY